MYPYSTGDIHVTFRDSRLHLGKVSLYRQQLPYK